MSIGRAELPIGTTEAAVRSCVSLFAAVMGQDEKFVGYWLDLYYQVRRAYEIEQEREPDPRLISREDLYPVLREMMRDALKSTAREKAAEKVVEKKAGEKRIATPACAPARNDVEEGGREEETPLSGAARQLSPEGRAKEKAEGDGADESPPP